MYNHVHHIAHLNQAITIKNQEIARLRASDTRHLVTINNLQTEVAEVRNQNRQLLDQLGVIERANEQLKTRLTKLKPKRHYKTYMALSSKGARQHRKREYKTIFDNVLEPMSDISGANINVKIGSENVNFLWKRPQPNQNQQSDDEDDNDLDMFNVGTSDIFDDEGNFVKPFLRSIVHVMDKHKISHEAYHETRMVTKGFMPPIHLIRNEKKYMSEEIEYIKHPTVCIIISVKVHLYSHLNNI